MTKTLLDIQPTLRKLPEAQCADLPTALRDLGYTLERDSSNGFRIPGNRGLIIWRNEKGLWVWTQHSVGEGGDAISFLIKHGGMNRLEAIETLAPYKQKEIDPLDVERSSRPVCRMRSGLRIKKDKDLPTPEWQERASGLSREAKTALWERPDNEVWQWLHARGLSDETIAMVDLGLIGKNSREPFEDWGLPVEYYESGEPRELFLPAGLLIPVFDRTGNPKRLWVRRFDESGPKYYVIPSSTKDPLILGRPGQSVVLCETDLDAHLIRQEAGDLITAASLGTSGGHPNVELMSHLVTAPNILISLDTDEAGRKATGKWLETFPNAKNWPVPWSKDPGEAFGAASALVRAWIQAGLN
jgi:DNA primase